MIISFCDGGAGAPQSLVDSLSSLSRELVDARRFSSDLQGANRPPHSDLGFRLIGNDSLLLLLVHLCLGDNHTPLHLTSLPQIRPDAHFAKGGDSSPPPPPPHPKETRLPVEFRLMMSANPLRFSYCQAKGRVTGRLSPCPMGTVT